MSKKWTYADFEFAVDSAWSAFENTLKAHGTTPEEIKKFKWYAAPSMMDVGDYFAQAITWREEE